MSREILLGEDVQANALGAEGRHAQAEKIFREAVAAERRTFGDRDTLTLLTMHNLGNTVGARGR